MERWNIIFGGSAGTGPNFLTNLLGKALIKSGYGVFYSRDYQSLIRGGHNFNQLTFSKNLVRGNDSKIDILVCLDDKTEKIHSKDLKKKGVILKSEEKKNSNVYFAGKIFKLLGIDFKILDNELKNEKRYKENIKLAKKGYDEGEKKFDFKKLKGKKVQFMNGSQGISEGAIKSGLDIYFAYPMTPATPVIGELAEKEKEKNIITIELENEIAVANAGVGSTITGAKTMVGTSGGGFDLMSETLSLCGMAEVPLVFYLSQRPGPSTGVATYTEQGDLNIARHAGHGEFPRIVLASGDPIETEELTNQCFYLSQKFQTPSIIVSDKHLGESFYGCEKKSKIISVPRKTKLKRYNSYEKNPETGSATEEKELVKKEHEKRLKKQKDIEKESKKFERYSVYGKKNSKNVIISWGSTKGAILDAIEDIDCTFIQIKYIEPFPLEIEKKIKDKNLILIENNSTGQLGSLIREKTGIEIKKKILRYDARPFFVNELEKEIRRKLK